MIHPRTLRSIEFDAIVRRLASHCSSDAGRTLALACSPLESVQTVARACRLLEETRQFRSAAIGLSPGSFPDLSGLLQTAEAPDLEGLWAIRQTLATGARARRDIVESAGSDSWPLLRSLATEDPAPETLYAALLRCISEEGALKDESSPELYRIRLELRRLHQSCLAQARDYAARYNMQSWLQDDFMTLANDRYVLPVKVSYKGRLQGIVHDYSQTGETCYFEPAFLMEINNRLSRLKHEERQEELAVIAYLGDLFRQEKESVAGVCRMLARLDLLMATLALGDELDGRLLVPGPASEGVALLGARHPLLCLQRKEAGAEPVRPVDIVLEPGKRTLVITGGNAGGKTVCLKSMGLITAMALSGLPVPVGPGSRLPWFERMDAFIGDEQSLSENVSTFTAQIDHLAKAWKHLDEHGLVLLDEFGSGTDPAQGSALAQGLLDELLAKGVFTLAATHFPALKTYALTREGTAAASVLFDASSRRPLFKLAYGQVGASQALDVARAHGLPPEIIRRAENYLLQAGDDTGSLLERLNALAARREKELEAMKEERKREKSEAARLLKTLESERERLRGEIRRELQGLMQAWKEGRASARQTLREMRNLRASILKEDSTPPLSAPQAPDKDFAPGQSVMHSVFRRRGSIREIDSKKQRALLELDGVSLWANFADLIPQGTCPKTAQPSGTGAVSSAPASMRLDLRGQRGEESLTRVERFLDRAILAGFSHVDIVHGRGTGALRRQIHSFLKSSPAVASFCTAPEDHGGDGMTVVTLR